MPAYLTVAEFKNLTVMPSGDVDVLEAVAPGFLTAKLEAKSRWLDARLAKRYDAPFASPYPEAVKDWLARIVTLTAFLRRGVDATDEQFVEIKADAEKAEAEVLEAAESEKGLFELPLRADTTASGISKGGPFGYSEASPYVWTDRQRRAATDEDANGEGSYG